MQNLGYIAPGVRLLFDEDDEEVFLEIKISGEGTETEILFGPLPKWGSDTRRVSTPGAEQHLRQEGVSEGVHAGLSGASESREAAERVTGRFAVIHRLTPEGWRFAVGGIGMPDKAICDEEADAHRIARLLNAEEAAR